MSRRPGKFTILATALVVGWLMVAGGAGTLFGKLSSVQKNDNADFLPDSAESTKVFIQSAKFSTQDNNVLPALIVFTGGNNVAGVASLAQSLPATPVENSTKTVGDFLVPGVPLTPVPSADGQAVLLPMTFDGDVVALPLDNDKPALPELMTAVRVQAATVTGFSETHVTGIGAILADLFDSFSTIDSSLLLVALGVVAVILLFVYRSPVLWILPLLGALTALATAGGIVYLLAKDGLIDLDGQSQGILSVLVIGAATDYALLLIARYREELHHHDSRFVAMRAALKGVVEPIVASGLTVVAGLAVLGLSELKNVRSLGPVAAIGIIAAQFAMLTFLPAMLVLAGRWVFWPRIPRHDDVDDKLSGVWSKVAGLVGRRPRPTWIASTGILLAGLAFAPMLNTGGLSLTDGFTGKPDSVVGLTKLAEHFPAGAGDPTVVIVPQADIATVTAALTSAPGVSTVVPTFDGPVVPGLPTPPVKVVDGLARLEVTLDKPATSLEAQEYVPGLRAAVHQASPTALVGGATPIQYDTQEAAKHDRELIIPVALAVISVILALLLRSLLAPLLLVVTTVLSFGATLGVCHVVFTYLFDFPATDGSFPLFAFVFLVALGIDYNIFLMTRVREESAKLGTREGTLKGLTVTGGVITSAGIVLAATFAVLGTLPLVFIAEIGFAVAFGVLLDTILVRSLLVPALTYDLGKVVWWPSRLWREGR